MVPNSMAIVIVSTGGTIASTEDSGKDARPELTSDDLLNAVPKLNEIANIVTTDFSKVPSPHFTIDNLYELTQLVNDYDDDPDIDGVVITQGTDTLEESAYFVECCYGGETPVVFTGAMRNPSLASPDGPNNLIGSVRAATSENARQLGTLISFNERLYTARDTTKMHSMNVDTFRSPEFGPIATIDEERINWVNRPFNNTPTFTPDPDLLSKNVHAVTVTANMSGRIIDAARDGQALCLAATGAGHIPPSIIPSLERVKDAGLPIIATTRCPEGRLARHTYDFKGSEATLRNLRCYFSSRNLQQTRIKAIVAIAAGKLDEAFVQPE